MITPEGFEGMVQSIMARGYTRDKAEDYASWIGDTPELDPTGLWVIRDDNGNVIDRIEPLEEEE